jgi:hypothetical protein
VACKGPEGDDGAHPNSLMEELKRIAREKGYDSLSDEA